MRNLTQMAFLLRPSAVSTWVPQREGANDAEQLTGWLAARVCGDREDSTRIAHVGRQWLGRCGRTNNGIVTVTTPEILSGLDVPASRPGEARSAGAARSGGALRRMVRRRAVALRRVVAGLGWGVRYRWQVRRVLHGCRAGG